MTPHAKFHVNLPKGDFLANTWNSYMFFLQLTYRSDPSADFSTRWLKQHGLVQGCAFWG